MKRGGILTHRSKRSSLEDTYFTPQEAVKRFLALESFSGVGWEPSSGSGNIAKCFDPPLMSSDLSTEDWVFGEKGVDFLTTNREVDFIITNPPYCQSLEFAKHALECAPKVAFLIQIQWLESRKRSQFLEENPPKFIYINSDRIKCCNPRYNGPDKGGLSSQCLAWFVWERGYQGCPMIRWIKPYDRSPPED